MRTDINVAWDALLPWDSIARLDQTPFLTRCREESVSRRELEEFLVQQSHYAKHFIRYLCALLVNLAAEEDRTALIENLFEEMGYGDVGDEPHSEMFRKMLAAFDLDPAASTVLPETEALVTTMLKLCSDANPLVGLGALCIGAEAIVPHIYGQITRGLSARGFAKQHLQFFTLHIEGDDDHALTMKAIIDRELTKNPDGKMALLRSANECIDKRIAFFEAISRNARRNGLYREVAYAV